MTDSQPLDERVTNRSLRPDSPTFLSWVTSGWAPRGTSTAQRSPAADYAAQRRARLLDRFDRPVRLVVPAGTPKVRSNDTDYRFRPHAAFAHLTGLGAEQEPDAVLTVGPGPDDATLYLRPPAGRDTPEFFADAATGEFWVGSRPTLDDMATVTGLRTADLADLRDGLAQDVGDDGVQLLVVPLADAAVTALVDEVRGPGPDGDDRLRSDDRLHSDDQLREAVSELRLVKDAYEVAELRTAVAATVAGFEQVVRALPRALAHPRGERVVEGTFLGHARTEGNAVGYETIAAAGPHATTLHWTDDDGPVRPGDLLLLDAGVEADSLYTADLTRTLPVDGRYTPVQRRVYQAVLDAADAAFAVVRPGVRFREVHDAAMQVLAHRLADWGLLPVPPQIALDPDQQQHRRWMVHGTSHHLGLDVHDCAQARRTLYLDGVLEPGMVLTVEPGLYFQPDDLLVPPEYRGIGVRIEDDVLVTADGCENLSAALPRTPDAVETWMAALLPG
ncbi:MAG: aminopeptidase P family protein [Micrococcales bacterium]|nr:aminopeptidase P family protein [Micrococcales bacterium]